MMDTLETGSVPEFGEDEPEPTINDKQPSAGDSVDEGRSAAILAYIPFLCFVPLTTMRHNQFALHHGKQGLVLLMLEVLAVIFMIPKISGYFWALVIIFCVGSAIAGILFAVQGKETKLPYISDIAEKLKI
jgi:uncharacterized membrane protein